MYEMYQKQDDTMIRSLVFLWVANVLTVGLIVSTFPFFRLYKFNRSVHLSCLYTNHMSS